MIARAVALGLLCTAGALAAQSTGRLDTLRLRATALGVEKTALVYLPPTYTAAATRRYPVLYYLHGRWGQEHDWVVQGRLPQVMDSLAAAGRGEAIVVMPDGDDGWYTTWHTLLDIGSCRADTARTEPAATYCVPWPHYDDYIAHDVVRAVDARYRTVATRRGRGIAGLSMGGYGALTLALRYTDRFAAAASHSGVLAPRLLGPVPFTPPGRFARTPAELAQAAGARWSALRPVFGADLIGWERREPAWLLARAAARGAVPALFVDCGTADPLVDQARAFRAAARARGVPLTYAEWPGRHDWDYWRAHVGESAAWLLAQLSRPR